MVAIHVEGLTKSYGSNRAVDGISFDVSEGEIFGLLGPNGAGKTTTVEILEGLREPDTGKVEVFGTDVGKTPDRIRHEIGVALQTTTLMQNLTSWEILDLFGSFYRNSVSPDSLLERLGLQEKRNALVKTLSGGQQQRLSVALALVNKPKLVFLDEPTTGLDPQARRGLWEVIVEMRKEGLSVLLTTHYMEEAEQICDRIAIIDHGKILAMNTPARLVKEQFSERAIQFRKPEGTTTEDFAALPSVLRAAEEEGDIVLYCDQVQRSLGALLEKADGLGLELDDVHIRRATLEDVFIKLTGRRIRE
jgi:ABC-2 type transport system ATP-binding protein